VNEEKTNLDPSETQPAEQKVEAGAVCSFLPPNPIKGCNQQIVRLLCEKASFLKVQGVTPEEAFVALYVSPEIIGSILATRFKSTPDEGK